MAKVRISTTVDGDLLQQARACCDGAKDASVMERALKALVAEHRATEIDRRIDSAYREHPLDEPDEWGDLASYMSAAQRPQGAAE